MKSWENAVTSLYMEMDTAIKKIIKETSIF